MASAGTLSWGGCGPGRKNTEFEQRRPADGALIELNAEESRIDFYEAMPDKNDEVWASMLHGSRCFATIPRPTIGVAYHLPEPYAYDRRTVIEMSRCARRGGAVPPNWL